MALQYYHNESCSKSRAALALLQAAGCECECVHYLEQAPSVETVLELARKLAVPVHALVRDNEVEYAAFAAVPVSDNQAWAAAIHAQPRLLQRPILVSDTAAVVCRPPELALTWLTEQGHEHA